NENIEPILYKGWSASQFYPEAALRPYLDFDLIVPVNQYKRVTELIASNGIRNFDLEHYELNRFDSRSYDELLDRSELINLGDIQIRVPCVEDHLRLLCIHLLKHGGSGPLWLCDIAAVVESISGEFDWNRFLGNRIRQANWVAYTIELAHRILGAQIDHTPVPSMAKKIPLWMERSIIKDWSTPRRILHIHDTLMIESLKSGAFFSALRLRWPNPIEAAVIYNGSFSRLTTPAHQFRLCASQAIKFAAKLRQN
ncbi:MAG TPA: nucleotidyltransferase family protein, partial [Blastocatellia bacterium]|nr:nucleotidyltransferase family protein [Blastocatellia bacterium]